MAANIILFVYDIKCQRTELVDGVLYVHALCIPEMYFYL